MNNPVCNILTEPNRRKLDTTGRNFVMRESPPLHWRLTLPKACTVLLAEVEVISVTLLKDTIGVTSCSETYFTFQFNLQT